jgi:hypothetical protein
MIPRPRKPTARAGSDRSITAQRDAPDASPEGHHASPPSQTSNNHGVLLLPGAVASLAAWSILAEHSPGKWLDEVCDLVVPPGHTGDSLEGPAK